MIIVLNFSGEQKSQWPEGGHITQATHPVPEVIKVNSNTTTNIICN